MAEKARYTTCTLPHEELDGPRFRWVYDRVARAIVGETDEGRIAVLQGGDTAIRMTNEMVARLDFTVMHEFAAGDHFDWHMDRLPSDGSSRGFAINVLLSEPDAAAPSSSS